MTNFFSMRRCSL